MDEPIKKLEARIVELEQALSKVPRRGEPANVSAEELKTYQKVRDALAADWGDECGINECLRCIPCIRVCGGGASFRCISKCINECICGPCNVCSTGGGGGFGGFGGFGS